MWEDRYAVEDYVFGTEPAQVLLRHRDLFHAGDEALCVADGEGRNSVWLAQQGLSVTAWDGARSAVEKARSLAASRGVRVHHSVEDATTWDWPEAHYDLVVAIFIQFAGPKLREVLFARMARALRPGGRLLLHGYTPKQLDYRTGGPGRPENLYTEELLRTAFPELEIEYLESYEAELSEGRGHNGRSALIDLVAVRP